MDFERFIKELNSLEGLEYLKPDKNGTYSLRINHLHLVYFSESFNKEELYLYAPLCNIPIDDKEKIALFDQLLSANLFGQDTGRGWFAIDHSSNQILLINRISSDSLSKHFFTEELSNLVSCLVHWKKIVDHFAIDLQKPETPPEKYRHIYIKP